MGDLLLTVEDDKLAEILLQANGVVVLTIQQQLASACDTGKNTWLDRMVKLGSYDKLKTAFGKNMKSGNVAKTLEKQFRNQAGANAFTMSPKKWIDATAAIGIVVPLFCGQPHRRLKPNFVRLHKKGEPIIA